MFFKMFKHINRSTQVRFVGAAIDLAVLFDHGPSEAKYQLSYQVRRLAATGCLRKRLFHVLHICGCLRDYVSWGPYH